MSDDLMTDECAMAFVERIEEVRTLDEMARVVREIERATIAALAQRSGVDVEELAQAAYDGLAESTSPRELLDPVRDAIVVGVATAEARHAERERRWLELYRLARTNYDGDREDTIAELLGVPVETREQARRVLGLEG